MADVNYLIHSSGPWKKHKYIKKVGDRYYYTKGLEAEAELRQLQRQKRDLERRRAKNSIELSEDPFGLKAGHNKWADSKYEEINNTRRATKKKEPEKELVVDKNGMGHLQDKKEKTLPEYLHESKMDWFGKVWDQATTLPAKERAIDQKVSKLKKDVNKLKNGENFIEVAFLKGVNAGSKAIDSGKNFVVGLFGKDKKG